MNRNPENRKRFPNHFKREKPSDVNNVQEKVKQLKEFVENIKNSEGLLEGYAIFTTVGKEQEELWEEIKGSLGEKFVKEKLIEELKKVYPDKNEQEVNEIYQILDYYFYRQSLTDIKQKLYQLNEYDTSRDEEIKNNLLKALKVLLIVLEAFLEMSFGNNSTQEINSNPEKQ